MKRIKITLVASLLLAVTFAQAQDYKADVSKSKVGWQGDKIGKQHQGKIALKSGVLTLKSGNIKAGTFVMDMNSITDDDLTDANWNAKLIGHLKSDDFFGVAQYPESKLVITTATNFKTNICDVTASLTIKDKTNPVQFKVTKVGDIYKAHIVVDRSKFNVKFGSTSFFEGLGDKAINNDFNLDVELVLETK